MGFPTVDELEQRRNRAGISLDEACRRAGIFPSTWRRNVRGTTAPNTRTLRKMSDALTALIEEQAGKQLAGEGV